MKALEGRCLMLQLEGAKDLRRLGGWVGGRGRRSGRVVGGLVGWLVGGWVCNAVTVERCPDGSRRGCRPRPQRQCWEVRTGCRQPLGPCLGHGADDIWKDPVAVFTETQVAHVRYTGQGQEGRRGVYGGCEPEARLRQAARPVLREQQGRHVGSVVCGARHYDPPARRHELVHAGPHTALGTARYSTAQHSSSI